jgi:GNAT superfamily N-acetyltransferase
MHIRPYAPDDFGPLSRLWEETGIRVSYNDPRAEVPRILANRNCQLYVGTEDGKIIAGILVGHDGYRGWIYKLAVMEAHRGRGHGTELVRHAERWLAARGQVKCNLMIRAANAEATGFYEKLGYAASGHACLGRWLTDGVVDMEPAKIDVIVTYLEMTERSNRATPPLPAGNHALMRVEHPTVDFYRFLYDKVGEKWFWIDRRRLTDAELLADIAHPKVELYVLYAGGQPAGYVELDRRPEPDINFAYFGLIPSFIGKGLGKYLMHWIVDKAWSYGPRRLTVDTCTLDHPRALGQYQQAGFHPYKQEHKRIIDPRLEGLLPAELEPRLPEALVAAAMRDEPDRS